MVKISRFEQTGKLAILVTLTELSKTTNLTKLKKIVFSNRLISQNAYNTDKICFRAKIYIYKQNRNDININHGQ